MTIPMQDIAKINNGVLCSLITVTVGNFIQII